MRLGNKQALIPLFDYANNAESLEKANIEFFRNGSHVGFAALKHIKRGTEMRWNYKVVDRASPDQIFSTWQYVTKEQDILFRDDEHEFIRIFQDSHQTEADKIKAFVSFIEHTLKEYSTTLSQDKILAAAHNVSTIKQAMIRLRMLRKQILKSKAVDVLGKRGFLKKYLEYVSIIL
jgi:hypothetical protein